MNNLKRVTNHNIKKIQIDRYSKYIELRNFRINLITDY